MVIACHSRSAIKADTPIMEPVSTPVFAPRRQAGTTAYEQGVCGRGVLHASRKTLQGAKAICDGRQIVAPVTGRFDATTQGACAACVVATTR